MALKNKSYSVADWSIMINIILIIIIIFLVKGCDNNVIKTPIKRSNIISKEDSVIIISSSEKKELNKGIGVIRKTKLEIIKKHDSINIEIKNTPKDLQFEITKRFCPFVSDTLDLMQVNLCLEDGNKSAKLLFESLSEIAKMDSIIKLDSAIIQNQETKITKGDSAVNELGDQIFKLDNELVKYKDKAKRRGIIIDIGVGVIISLIAIAFVL